MKKFILDYNLYILTALGACVLVYLAINWSAMAVLQRCICLFDIGIILHLWEEGKFPGGFTTMITEKLKFTQKDPHFGSFVTAVLVLLIGFVPLFFTNVPFLIFAGIFLGYIESFAHIAAIKIFDKKKPYTPGMVSALIVLLPISIYTTIYLVRHSLMAPWAWLCSVAYLVVCIVIAQQIVVRSSGMKYSEFIGNIRKAVLNK